MIQDANLSKFKSEVQGSQVRLYMKKMVYFL